MIYWFDKDERQPNGVEHAARILIVEDEPSFAASLVAILEHAGWQAQSCHSGEAGLQRLAEEPFDLALVDLGLPGMSGHDVIREIAKRGLDLPVIVVSGETQIDAVIGALRLGALDYVRKPLEPAFLLHRIRRALKEHRLELDHLDIQNRVVQSERLHRFLVDQSPDIIFTLDLEGRITFVNDRMREELGLDREAVIGQHFSVLAHGHDRERARWAFSRERLDETGHHNLELRLANPKHADGFRHYEIQVYAYPYCQCDGTRPEGVGIEPCLYGVARDIDERHATKEWAAFHAIHDPLTGLPNRNLFLDRVGLSLTQAKRDQGRFAVIHLNLDRFSSINDLYGHAQADELLQEVAARIQSCLRGGDTLARFAADEFLLLNAPIACNEDVLLVIKRIRQELSAPFDIHGESIHVCASAGIAVFPEDGDNPESLIRHANIALYQCRLSGIHKHAFFDEAMRAHVDLKLQIEHDLRHAVERSELELHFQPQVELGVPHIRGAEALVRWRHPQRGLIAPGEFISIAEETGLITPLSDWVVEAACRILKGWKERGIAPPRLSINVSPRYVEEPDFVERFVGHLERYRIEPDRIEVELTENLFIRDPAAVVRKLNDLAAHGIHIAIDDFGTQYSSLGYLHKFPIHTLKIDKSFVWEIDREFPQHTVIKAILSIGHGLGLNLVAEGVETEEQLKFLRSHGCHLIQGYLISKPLPAGDIEEMLLRDSTRTLRAV